MSTKSHTVIASEPEIAIEDDERHTDQVDDYVSRNSRALNQSIEQSREEIAKGRFSRKSLGRIIAEGKARLAQGKSRV